MEMRPQQRRLAFASLLAAQLILGSAAPAAPANIALLTRPEVTRAQSAPSMREIVERYSSTERMPVDEFRVLMDNEASFREKLSILNNARAGDRVYMMYYIHSSDETTSLINKAMVEAARRGAQVHLMVDFLTNYNNLDMFNMMRVQGGLNQHGAPNLDIRFFNPPTSEIHRDALYLTTNCLGVSSARCREAKEETVRRVVESESVRNRGWQQHLIGGGHFFSRLFLAGLSGKSSEALRTALIEGGGDPRANMPAGGEAPTEAERRQLMEFMRILFGAKVMGNTMDKIKLGIAMVLYGEKVGPIYEALGNALPMHRNGETLSARHWEAITQFTHHKLLARISADGRSMEFLNGGRNLENSYHLNENLREMIQKYLFADTDTKMTVSDPRSVSSMEAAIRDLHNYREMVIRIEEVNRYLPVDYIKEIETVKQVIEELRPMREQRGMTMERYTQAIEERVRQVIEGKSAERQQAELTKMNDGVRRYNELHAARGQTQVRGLQPDFVVDLDPEDRRRARISYVENLPFREVEPSLAHRFKNALRRTIGLQPDTRRQRERIYDPIMGFESRDNKNIHGLWVEWLQREAAEAAAERRVRTIYLHQGYLYMPSNMVQLFARMMDGTINSEYLEIKIITNSIRTTDLNVMNVLSRHQLKALFEYYEQNQGRRGVLRGFNLYEYNVMENGNKTSLHAKAMFSESRMFIGSANADVRSYHADTNNGVFVEDAPRTARRMVEKMQTLINDNRIMTNVTSYYRRSHTVMLQEDMHIVKELAAKYERVGARIAQNEATIGRMLMEKMTSIYLMTGLIADHRGAHNWLGRFSTVRAPVAAPPAENAGGGGAAAAGSGNLCAKIFDARTGAGAATGRPNEARTEMLNTRPEMIQKINRLRENHGPTEIGPFFDRLNQLI